MKTLIAGTFDNFHVGHQWLIWEAYNHVPAELVIIVARDKTVKRIKGKPPQNSELERLDRIQQEVVNFENIQVRLGRSDQDFWMTITEESPERILLGYDQQFNEAAAFKRFPKLKIERASAYQPNFFKSSKF